LRLLEAATTRFATQGFDNTSIKDVATEAGVSVGLVCRYFPSREHLALAVFDRFADRLAAQAVELPPGTLASRFASLMLFRIEQVEEQRRPLTALMGKALDPTSPLYALGPATDATRAKVQGALGVVIAGASDAPKTPEETASQAQLLYLVHLGVVLATLARPDATAARLLVRQGSRALSWLRLPLVRQWVGKHIEVELGQLLGGARSARHRDVAGAILDRVFRNNRVLPGVAQGLTPAAEALHRPRIESAVRAGQPIELVLPAFPAKAPNPKKVLGALPDLAEQRALQRLSELLDEIETVYAPGALLTICSDGHVFADAVGLTDATVDAYKRALLALVDDERVRWFDLGAAFGERIAPPKLRAMLMNKYAESEDALRARSSTSSSLAAQIDGIHRFLFEDAVVLHPEVTKNQLKQQTRAQAYEVVRRSEAWGALVADVFPQALRLSIHPQPDPSTKIGINLLGVNDPWLTPWHGVAVVDRSGTRLMHRSDAEDAGGIVVVDASGQPSHMELP
jgi:pyoverdine/dityrosine biosynthesis protein Dit1